MEIGGLSFGSVEIDPATGKPISSAQGIRNLLEAIELADQVGLDYFGVGEHHQAGMPIPNPGTVLAAAAARTTRIRLGSSITVLAADDPVRVYEQFATIDALSHGRVEITAGRGAAPEPFTLFGVDLADYDEAFAEKFDLLQQLGRHERLTWSGHFRPPLDDAAIVPRPEQHEIPIWLATGGNPNSIIRAARQHARVFFSDVGADPARFEPLARLYREASAQAGTPEENVKIGFANVGLIADASVNAADTWWPHFDTRSREMSGRSFPRELYDRQTKQQGSFFTGTPEQIAERIITLHELIHHDRHLVEADFGRLPHAVLLRHIELLGTIVKPLVDAEIE